MSNGLSKRYVITVYTIGIAWVLLVEFIAFRLGKLVHAHLHVFWK